MYSVRKSLGFTVSSWGFVWGGGQAVVERGAPPPLSHPLWLPPPLPHPAKEDVFV